MAEPEDHQPDAPPPHDDFDDDLVGFASPRSLHGSVLPVASMAPVDAEEAGPESPDVEPEPAGDIFAAAVASDAPSNDEDDSASDAEPSGGAGRPAAADPDDAPPSDPEPESEATTAPEDSRIPDAAVGAAMAGAAMASRPVDEAPLDPMNTPIDDQPMQAADADPASSYGQAGATRTFDRPAPQREPGIMAEGDARLSVFIYACLIAAGFTGGATALVALVLGWMGRFMVKGWVESHITFQICTSLIGVIAAIVGVLTLPLGLGVFILALNVVWLVVRGAAGLFRLMRREEIQNPQTWGLP